MAEAEEKPQPITVTASKSSDLVSPNSSAPKSRPSPPSTTNNGNSADTSPKKPLSARDFIVSVASKLASQPLQNSDPEVWGVLTAISNNARKRHQGINILLTADEHCIGRVVGDSRFQIESNAVSANHCKIYRMRLTPENMDGASNCETSVFLKDTSTNGTFLNWEKLNKNSDPVKIQHGDIVSFAAPPQHESAFAFVFRELLVSSPMMDNAVAKRKAGEEFVSESKRIKGIGIGAPEGPISLDDFRSLQRSNTELRKQLEEQVLAIETLRNENRVALERHENEMKEVKESVTNSYIDKLKELHHLVETKQKELWEVSRVSAEQKQAIGNLNERLSASMQSCAEANAIINSQKVKISELKEQLDEEQSQRRGEREKAAADLKAVVQRVQLEAQEELKQQAEVAMRRERELQEVINKLQESERERCLLVETLRSKLEETRQKLVISDNKVRQLETQVHEVQQNSSTEKRRVEELEHEIKRMRKELENEKAAREEAWAKVSVLELERDAALRDRDYERRRLKGARERIMLRETQLRAFYSTTEEISVLFGKQQKQLKAMQRTLEDEENYENTSVDIVLDRIDGIAGTTVSQEKEVTSHHTKSTPKVHSASSTQKHDRDRVGTSNGEDSVTEKHDCDIRSEECQNTQEAEFTSALHDNDQGGKGGFGSEIDGIGTAPVMDADTVGTERVLETESPGIDCERAIDLNKCSALDGDTMRIDDESHIREIGERSQTPLVDTQKAMEDTEPRTVRTSDLLASEGVGSWACSTAPSVHGENESPGRDNNEEGVAALRDSDGQVAESQSTPSSEAAAVRRNAERQALGEMIGIVAPDLREHFGGNARNGDRVGEKCYSSSDSDTEGCSDTGDYNGVKVRGGSISDAETEGSDQVEEDGRQDDRMDEDFEATQEDSQG